MDWENALDGDIAAIILDGLPMGALFCDRNGIVRFVNSSYAQLLEKNPEEIIGYPITKSIPDSRAQEVMRNGVAELGDLCRLAPSSSRVVIVNRLPVRDKSGAVCGMISQALFNNPEELRRLSAKIDQLGRKLSQYKKRFQASAAPQHTFASIIGDSPVMRATKRQAASYARLDEPVLILGATGAGKELFAHAIHAESPRASGPLVCINCAAVPRDLFESELFGYARGAFSGARQEGKMGQIELADNGTLFLDEIGEMPPEIQVKLLRVLESRTVVKLGSSEPRAVNFRLIAATNRDIAAMLKNGAFREDLFYRINAFTLEIPPLRERSTDILAIARHTLDRLGLESVAFAPETERAMLNFEWPGNARQLRNAVARAATMREGDLIRVADFPPETLPSMTAEKTEPAAELSGVVASAEARFIQSALDANRGNVAATARALKISRATLYEKIRKLGLDIGRKKS
ncbi:MAG: sigma 54-interacting transcriptional regulator [Desulfovibrio sp.]|nr:sigma 54-interacting transcriptional regulator [Desulfovibrio sp.]